MRPSLDIPESGDFGVKVAICKFLVVHIDLQYGNSLLLTPQAWPGHQSWPNQSLMLLVLESKMPAIAFVPWLITWFHG